MSNSISHVRASVVALVATVLSLGGCATVVYKDAAASYVAASKDLTKQLNEVSGRLTLADSPTGGTLFEIELPAVAG